MDEIAYWNSDNLINYPNIDFKNNEIFEQIGDEIWFSKYFINKDFCLKVSNYLDNFEKEDWHKFHYNQEMGDIPGHDGIISPPLNVHLRDKFFNEITSTFAFHGYWLFQHPNFIRQTKNDERFFEGEKCISLSGDKNVRFYPNYAIAIFFGNFEGGAIKFPRQNVEVSPKAGDTLIFPPGERYSYTIENLKSGTKYAYVDYIYDHPGYFYV